MNQKLFDYIAASPTAFHAVARSAARLEEQGYQKLSEGQCWSLCAGQGYYVTRNDSSLIAFRLPAGRPQGFMMAAAHGDSPCFKIKENPELTDGNYARLSVEKYGGMLCATWMDRPLSVAGRVMLRSGSGLESRLVDLKEPVALIPSVAIHMNRAANENASYNPAVDMIPLLAPAEHKPLLQRVAEALGVKAEDILTTDLYLYAPDAGCCWSEFISAPRLDDLQCAFAALEGFLSAEAGESVPVYALFDNEEVGSQTKQGAASTFLADTIERIGCALGLDAQERQALLSHSFLISCDNAHAVHPNHPEYADKNHAPKLNGGIVIKYNASQRYTTDAVSAGLFQLLCEQAQVPFQRYANRADMPGGSTLGNISNTQVSLNTVDIGLPQLAMHSAFETAGASDTEYLTKALAVFFSKTLEQTANGCYTLK